MSDDASQVPRDLRRRLTDLDVHEGEYDPETLRALPERDELPDCPACSSRLQGDRIFASEGGVAVAIRLRCTDSAAHESEAILTYLYEIATRQLYLEARHQNEAGKLTVSRDRYRRDLERAARGESIESILSERFSE